MLDAGTAEDTTAPVSHVRQRKSILLRMPLGAELFLSELDSVFVTGGVFCSRLTVNMAATT